jgi:hypothetical protein
MNSEEKIKEIRKQLRGGVPEGEIREDLKEQGYSEEEINKFFVVHKYDMRSWYLAFAILLLLFSIWSFVNNGGVIFFGLSALLFIAYFREIERIKKQ